VKYTVEEVSACKKKVLITVEPEEINASIDVAVKLQQRGIAMQGFRKGHVPPKIIENRFKGQLYEDAKQDLVNVHINQVMQEVGLTPISKVDVSDIVDFERDKGIEYSISFEHLPVFDLPNYEGLEVEQVDSVPTQDEVDAFILKTRENNAKMTPVDGTGPAKPGQFANIDFALFIDGKQVKEQTAQGFDYLVGQKNGLAELEELASTLQVGQSGERDVTFPDDFMNKNLAGKSGVIKVTVHAVKERPLPAVEELFKKMNVTDLEGLRKRFSDIMYEQRKGYYRSEACTKLLGQLLKLVDFPLPQTLMDIYFEEMIAPRKRQAMQAGKALTDEQIASLRESLQPRLTEAVKTTVFLVAVAKKEGLEVTDSEVQNAVFREAADAGVEPKTLYEFYVNSGLIFNLRDRLLADKGMLAIYEKAKVTLVPEAKAAEAKAGDAKAAESKAPEAKADEPKPEA